MRQCPDCEEKDRVVIAGKVFCANCGSPWQAADPSEQEKYLQKVGLGTAPAEAAPLPAAAPSAEQAQATAIDAAMKAANLASPEPVASPVLPASPPSAPPTPAQAPIPSPENSPVSAPAPAAPAPNPTPAPEPSLTPTPPPPSEAPATPAPAVPNELPTVAPVQAPTPPPVANPYPAPPAPVAVAVSPEPAVQTAAPKEDIGSEIPSLDGKDEDILSDGQLSELSTIQSAPTMTRPVDGPSLPPVPAQVPAPAPNPGAPVRTMSDITPPGSANTPASPTTPAPAANTPAADTTTIAGITMSRDDALKLALGPDSGDTAEPKKGPARPTAVVMSVLALALLGVYAWQSNYATLALKLAGMRSGVETAAPGYLPSGWTMSRDIQSSTGSVSFKVIKNSQELTVSQQKSGWDSQAVLEQYVLPRSSDYLALQAQGLTIYVYGAGEAAWVNHGTFYHLEGNHGLDQDQLIRVATGL